MKNGEQPAFPPYIVDAETRFNMYKEGASLSVLTKREYAAIMAMQGILTNPANNPS